MSSAFDVDIVLSQLTLKEKTRLLSGKDIWHTQSIPRLNVPSIRTSEGPNGVRGTRFFNGVPAACFPCGTAFGATWDTKLMKKAGSLMADEARAKGVHMILSPTVNIQRSPLGGRGFESFSEDPLLYHSPYTKERCLPEHGGKSTPSANKQISHKKKRILARI
ncbi:glycoside hydrolase superfamily [Ilyonectria destructans]|nr:glycoside hydrolase superfamily [Ilyonectria destructans]